MTLDESGSQLASTILIGINVVTTVSNLHVVLCFVTDIERTTILEERSCDESNLAIRGNIDCAGEPFTTSGNGSVSL